MATTQRPHDDLEAQTVDVEELEVRVDALSKGLEAERQERRRLQEENDELREEIERLDARTDLLKPDQTRRVLDPPDLHFGRPPTTYLWQTYDHVVDGDDCR